MSPTAMSGHAALRPSGPPLVARSEVSVRRCQSEPGTPRVALAARHLRKAPQGPEVAAGALGQRSMDLAYAVHEGTGRRVQRHAVLLVTVLRIDERLCGHALLGRLTRDSPTFYEKFVSLGRAED